MIMSGDCKNLYLKLFIISNHVIIFSFEQFRKRHGHELSPERTSSASN